MTSIETNKTSATRVMVKVHVPAQDVDRAIETAVQEVELLKNRPLGKKQLGDNPDETTRNAVFTRATRAIVEKAVRQAIEDAELRITENPSLDIADLVKEGNPFEFEFELKTVPECEIGDFRALNLAPVEVADVTEKDVDDKLSEIRQRAANIERASEDPLDVGDIAKISFTSTIDGKPYEGNSIEEAAYELGSNYLPVGFEAGLVGMHAGESKVIEFDVPADFDNGDIAGKHAVFDVKVLEVTKVHLPALDDVFAQRLGYSSLEDFKKRLRSRIAQEKEGEAELERERRARRALADLLIGEIPAELIDMQTQRMLQGFKAELSQQGIGYDDYLAAFGLTEEDVRTEMREEASHLVPENLALESLYRELGLRVTAADMQQTAADLALENGMSFDAPYTDMLPEQQQAIREMTMHRLATEWLMDNAFSH